MGIITNGFLIGAKKSAGGINFLKLRGQQVFRNKPQISASYVPTPAQILQRSLQSALTRSLKESSEIQTLIGAGWDRHDRKRTNANEFQRDALRLFTREADSTLSLIGDKESRMNEAATMGYAEYVISRMALGDMPLTKSTFEYPEEAISIEAGVASVNEEGVLSIKQYLGEKYTQDFVNGFAPRLVVLETPGTISLQEFPYTPVTPANVVSIAVAFPRSRNGEIVGWIYSTAVTPDFSYVDPTIPTVATVSVGGVDVTNERAVALNDGDPVKITGTNLANVPISLRIDGNPSAISVSNIVDITARTETELDGTVKPAADGFIVTGVIVGGYELWPKA